MINKPNISMNHLVVCGIFAYIIINNMFHGLIIKKTYKSFSKIIEN